MKSLILKQLLLIVLLTIFNKSYSQEKKAPLIEIKTSISQSFVEGCGIFNNPANYTCANSFIYNAPTNNNSGYSLTAGANTGCLYTTPNQIWFIITVNSLNSGNSTLTFTETNSNNRDVDAAIWGPITNNNLVNTCLATLNSPLACDYLPAANAITTLYNVQVGQKYVMLVTNYSNAQTNISITQPVGGNVTYCMSNFIPCTAPTASISGNQVINYGNSANLTLNFTGTAPWTYNIANHGSGTTSTNPLIIPVSPSQSTTYSASVSNGCGSSSSPNTARIVVCNPSIPPTATLTGTTTIPSGSSTSLRVNFTGEPPYNYSISNFGSGVTSTNPLFLSVSPSQTTTYTMSSVSNVCGAGNVSGSAQITVVSCGTATLDTNRIIVIHPSTATLKLSFIGNPPYSATLSDNTYVFSYTTPVYVTVTPNTNALKKYSIISASNACGSLMPSGVVSVYSCSSYNRPTATLVNTEAQTISTSDSITLNVAFSGDPPYTYTIYESNLAFVTAASGTTYSTNIFIKIKPTPSNYNDLNQNLHYKIATFTNPCGTGNIDYGEKLVKVCDKPTATLALGDELIDPSQNIYGRLDVTTTGSLPILLSYTEGSYVSSFNTFTPNYSYTVSTNKASTFVLAGVSNGCGIGTFSGKKTIRAIGFEKKLINCFPFDGNTADSKSNISTVVQGGVTLTSDRFENPNSAYEFNGTNGQMSFVNNGLKDTEFTYSFWVKPYSMPAKNNYYSVFDFSNDKRTLMFYTPDLGKFQLTASLRDQSNSRLYQTVTPIFNTADFINKWHHIVVNVSKAKLKLYLDGVQYTTIFNNFETGFSLNSTHYIGKWTLNSSNFHGKIDDVKLFHGSLNDDEMNTLLNLNNCNFEYQEYRTINLFGCYPFNANPRDMSELKNHGTTNNTILTSDRFGNANTAYQFDGSTSYISLPTENFRNYEYSISAWIKPQSFPSLGSKQTILYFGNSGGKQSINILDNRKISFTSDGTGTLTPASLISNNEILLNEWTNVVCVRTLNEDLIYINGNLEARQIRISSVEYSANALGRIGSGNNAYFFNGIIDDVKIFKGALYEAEAKAIYNEVATGCNYLVCPPSLNITNTISPTADQKASQVIYANNLVETNTNIKYTSEHAIILTPGFKVSENSVFTANIAGCPSNN